MGESDSENDEIIVFRTFSDRIEASLAKSKLDAYGIPCFLTEENMANLYPGEQLFFKVRLHVFKEDRTRVSEIFMETSGPTELTCPRCESTRIERDFPKDLTSKTLTGLKVVLFGVFFAHKKVNHCLDCDYEF